MDCNFLCSLPFRVWILILMYVCRLQEAVLKQRICEKKGKKEEKGDRDNVTKSACARSHKTKDQYKKKESKQASRFFDG